MQKLRLYFMIITLSSLVLLLFSWYNSYQFDSNPLSNDIKAKIDKKEKEIIALIGKHYGFYFNVPIIISDKLNSNLYGAAIYDDKHQIKIVLNKKRFKESLEYMIDDVLPHEYAHALMFKFGEFSKRNGGHTKRWQDACIRLGGSRCDRFVNHQDIIIGKTTLF